MGRPHLASVILPVYNGVTALGEQLEGLSAQDYTGDWEVVIVDNGSTDGSSELARSFDTKLPGLRVIEASARQGNSYARNQGAAAAGGDFLAFCDHDDVVQPGWLSGLVTAAAEADIVVSAFDEHSLNSPLVLSWFSPPPTGARLPRHLGYLPTVRSAGLGVPRQVFDAVGGFDESAPGNGEDAAFAWTAQFLSYRLGGAPDSVVAYRYRSTYRAVFHQALSSGAADAYLYRRFRPFGLRRPPFRKALRAWLSIILWSPVAVFNEHRRGLWARYCGNRVGRLRGSARFRVWFP